MVRTAADIIKKRQEDKDPALRLQRYMHDIALAEAVKKLDMYKGEPGYTPVRGVDYFTPEDVADIVARVRSMVRNGFDGQDGKDGKDGKDGITPIVGVDFFTEKEKEVFANELVSLVLSKIPMPKDGVTPDMGEVVEQVIDAIKVQKKVGLNDMHDIDKLVDFLKRGGFRGGGGSSSGSSTTFYSETPSGAINGSNVTYTTAHQIATVINFTINGQYIHPSDYSVLGNTITFNTPLDASLSGLPFTIIYV